MAEYPINKGVGRQVEFKRLPAQYLFLFAGGLLAVFIIIIIIIVPTGTVTTSVTAWMVW